MIIQEQLTIPDDQRLFIRTYSDAHRYVVRNNIEYEQAVDPEEFHRQYTEGRQIQDQEEPI